LSFALIPGPPSEWIYVEARDIAHATGAQPTISFGHVRVTAPSAEGAYYAGKAAIASVNLTAGSGHAKGRLLNDCVIPLQ
jgi:hypothetical protein